MYALVLLVVVLLSGVAAIGCAMATVFLLYLLDKWQDKDRDDF